MRNSITTISVHSFGALTKLVQLDLSNQRGYFRPGLESIDLNAFPQFIDLRTKSVIHTRINDDSDDFEKAELQWIKEILSYDGDQHLNAYRSIFFTSFSLNENGYPNSDLENLTNPSPNATIDSLIFGNLDLSNNRIVSMNLVKNN